MTLSLLLSLAAYDSGKERASGVVTSLAHMMNLNTFTCGAFHAASTQGVTKLADDLHTAITVKHWMCGFPDKLVTTTLD